MGRLVYHRKKDSGTTYVYEVVEAFSIDPNKL